MFEEMTFEAVLERMLDRIDDAYDKRESSPIYAAIAPAALEIVNLYAALGDMMDESFADTASREYLIRLAASRGMKPKPATKAIALAEFTPDTVELAEDAEFTARRGVLQGGWENQPRQVQAGMQNARGNWKSVHRADYPGGLHKRLGNGRDYRDFVLWGR